MASYINRYIKSGIVRDLKRKMVFIAGPRQAGKTTFAKELLKKTGSSVKKRYMNWVWSTTNIIFPRRQLKFPFFSHFTFHFSHFTFHILSLIPDKNMVYRKKVCKNFNNQIYIKIFINNLSWHYKANTIW